ncbi:DUF523 domain-containing protein [Chloroflexota bacterium]
MKLISACLLGIKCNWRGDDGYKSEAALNLASLEQLIPICPERFGGMDSPRPRIEIASGDGCDVLDGRAKVMTVDGTDVSDMIVAGASAVLKTAREYNATQFIGKSGSPSCGCGTIYDGTFSDKLITGDGVTAALLKRNGIEVISADNLHF